jgi:soluble lytic murein transglycosylase
LRNDWLLQLGQRSDWPRFNQVLAGYRMQDDKEVRCYALAANAPQAAAAAELKALWLRPKSTGEACTVAAQQYLAANLLSPDDAWLKARLALQTQQTGAAHDAVELAAPQALDAFSSLLKRPALFLKQTPPKGATNQTLELAVLALIRLAGSDPDEAAHLLGTQWAPHLGAAQRNWAWAAIGLQAAQRRQPQALDDFAHTQPNGLPDDMLQWWARAALRAGRWAQVRAALEALSPSASTDPAWVYWRARAVLQTAPEQAPEAQHLLRTVAGMRGFYEMLALEELGQSVALPAPPAPLTEAERAGARANPGLQRALAAIALGLRPEGVREWNYSTNLHTPGGLGERELLAAADLACAQQVWDRCINTSERTRSVFDASQRFPTPHRQAVVQRSAAIGLDPAFVYGLIRQESRFITDARSGVGASGLMQVMPRTAQWTAKKIGLGRLNPAQLNDSATNIAIGTGYLKLVLDDFGGSMPLAAAAYNAGPSRPRQWRGQAGDPVLEAAIWAENIPFTETRDYVKKVLANTAVYAAILHGSTPSLKAMLGQVGPRGGGVTPDTDLP